MEIQLTRTKTITIGGDASARGKRSQTRDLVGVDLFSDDPRGCPAVRLAVRKNALRVVAAGFVPPPSKALPDSWEAAAKKCTWSLPSEFQAPTAAFAVSSPSMFFAQTTTEAFRADLAAGGHREETVAARPKKLALIRPAAKVPAPASNENVPAAEPGVPVSNGGTRFVMRPMPAAKGFVLEAGLPEYQLLWLSRLLPEGHRPTASSIQLRPGALAASLQKSTALADVRGAALAVFLEADTVHVAGYRDGALVLWRDCPDCGGWRKIRQEVKDGLGLEENMVESVLDDALIDPSPVLAPALEPLFRELSVSRDYLVGKLEIEPKVVLVLGLKAGFAYWKDLVRDKLALELVEPPAFAGLACAERLPGDETRNGPHGHVFLGALGAALARLGEDEPEHGDTALHLNLLAEAERVSSSPVRLRVMAPVFAMLACLGMVVWWGLLFGRLLMVSAQTKTLKEDLARNEKAHAQALEHVNEAAELEAQLEQLDGYRLSRRTWGSTLSGLAEAMPLKVQLTRLEIPAPPPQNLTPPGSRIPSLWGPTGATERVSLVLSGRTPKETPLISLMESLESDAFTNALTVVKDPRSPEQSPRVRSFRQDAAAHGDGTRMLAFEIEYRARERRFAP